MLVLSFSLGTSQLLVHRRPYDHLPYFAPSSAFAAARAPRRKETPDQARNKGVGGDLVVHLPAELMKFCKSYASQKDISLDSFISIIVAQGIQATADADGCA